MRLRSIRGCWGVCVCLLLMEGVTYWNDDSHCFPAYNNERFFARSGEQKNDRWYILSPIFQGIHRKSFVIYPSKIGAPFLLHSCQSSTGFFRTKAVFFRGFHEGKGQMWMPSFTDKQNILLIWCPTSFPPNWVAIGHRCHMGKMAPCKWIESKIDRHTTWKIVWKWFWGPIEDSSKWSNLLQEIWSTFDTSVWRIHQILL